MANAETALGREYYKVWPRYLFGISGLTFFFSWVFSLMHSSVYLSLIESTNAFLVKEMFICSALAMAVLVWLFSRFSMFNNVAIAVLLCFAIIPTLSELVVLFDLINSKAMVYLWILAGAGTTTLIIFGGLVISSMEFRRSGLFPVIGIAVGVTIATCISLLGPSIASEITMCFPALSLFSYSAALSYHKQGSPNSIVTELKTFNAKPARTETQLIAPMLITVINSICLGFSIYYLFISASYQNNLHLLIFASILVFLCLIRIADFVKFQKIGSLFTALSIMPYVAICILPLSFLDIRFWTISCSIMLGISGLNVIINRSEVFVFAERSKRMSQLFFLYDCMGTIAGIGMGFFCSYLVFGEVFTGSIENIYMPSVLVIAITVIWSLISRKSLRRQTAPLESSEQLEAVDSEESFHSWHEKVEEFSNHYSLSPRQHEVLLLLAKGRNAEYIKEKLVISNHTAKAHIYNIYQKTDVNSRQELISLIEEFDVKHK